MWYGKEIRWTSPYSLQVAAFTFLNTTFNRMVTASVHNLPSMWNPFHVSAEHSPSHLTQALSPLFTSFQIVLLSAKLVFGKNVKTKQPRPKTPKIQKFFKIFEI